MIFCPGVVALIVKEQISQVEEEVGKVAEKASGEGGKVARRSRSFEDSTKSSRLRRKSLDSPSSSDAMKAIVRLNALEAKVGDGVEKGGRQCKGHIHMKNKACKLKLTLFSASTDINYGIFTLFPCISQFLQYIGYEIKGVWNLHYSYSHGVREKDELVFVYLTFYL